MKATHATPFRSHLHLGVSLIKLRPPGACNLLRQPQSWSKRLGILRAKGRQIAFSLGGEAWWNLCVVQPQMKNLTNFDTLDFWQSIVERKIEGTRFQHIANGLWGPSSTHFWMTTIILLAHVPKLLLCLSQTSRWENPGNFSEDEAKVNVKEVTFRRNLQIVQVTVANAQYLEDCGRLFSWSKVWVAIIWDMQLTSAQKDNRRSSKQEVRGSSFRLNRPKGKSWQQKQWPRMFTSFSLILSYISLKHSVGLHPEISNDISKPGLTLYHTQLYNFTCPVYMYCIIFLTWKGSMRGRNHQNVLALRSAHLPN